MPLRFQLRLSAWAAFFMIAALVVPTRGAGESARTNARLAADGRSFTISAAGFDDFRATWSATIQRDGAPERVLASTDGVVTPGPVTTIRFPEENIELLFQLESRSRCSGRHGPRRHPQHRHGPREAALRHRDRGGVEAAGESERLVPHRVSPANPRAPGAPLYRPAPSSP